jgi:chromate transporter
MSIDWPVAASVDIPALVLTVAAIVAIFRFKVGVLTVIGGCAAAGVLLHLIS